MRRALLPVLVIAAAACAATRSDPGVVAAAPDAESQPSAGGAGLTPVRPSELLPTSGEIAPDGPWQFSIRSPTFRAELGHSPRSAVGIAFVYRGPTATDEPLTSGELRRQIGLKLRARDTCNVVYVMWHIEPSSRIAVSVKSNPGQQRHSQCSDRGYAFLQPSSSAPVGVIKAGERHVLEAVVRDRQLRVSTDGAASWVGELPLEAFTFDGPVGLRSDNGEFSVELRAGAPAHD